MSLEQRVGYLTEDQFAERIAPTVGDELAGTFQPLDATLTDLAGRNIGAASATDILDRAAGDGRYALTGSGVLSFNTRTGAVTLTSGDVTTALTYTPTSVTGLTGVQSLAAFKTGLSLVKADVGLGSADNTADTAKNVLSATKLTTARTIGISGAVTGTATSFDGTGNITIPITAMDMASATTGTLAVARGGTGVTTSTGSGSNVLSSGPTFTGSAGFNLITATSISTSSSLRAAGYTGGGSGIISDFGVATSKGLWQSYNWTGAAYVGANIDCLDLNIRPGAVTVAAFGSAAVDFSVPVGLKSYTVATVPSAATAGRAIYVSNETGGAVTAFSDGTNWRRSTDRAVIA